ncbi:MAG: sialidase family protein [Kiritimatiellia bacterium]
MTDSGDRLTAVEPEPTNETPLWAKDFNQAEKKTWGEPCGAGKPFFAPPIPFVIPPADAGEPFHPHNHCPAITWCPNGDLLAAWFSTIREAGTEMTILASRLRAGTQSWEPAAEFFKAPNRNMTGTALFHDGAGTLYHFNGMGREDVKGWENLLALVRESRDNGVTWTPPRPLAEDASYRRRNQVIAGTHVTPNGLWLQPCDGGPGNQGTTALHISRDGGKTWKDPGGDIRGIHAGVVGLNDGRLLACGRAQEIDGRMPISISKDQGTTWSYHAGPFPPISNAQRLVLMRLREGPILLVSFTDACHKIPREQWQGMTFEDGNGRAFTGYGMYAALSFDEGATWPVQKLLTPGSGTYDGRGHTGEFTCAFDSAEPEGYLAATQTPDGVIHLVSSGLHYQFNLAWLSGNSINYRR